MGDPPRPLPLPTDEADAAPNMRWAKCDDDDADMLDGSGGISDVDPVEVADGRDRKADLRTPAASSSIACGVCSVE